MPKLPKAFKKRIPPPPRQPGTHTNAEVKEALHARALRRTIVVAALMVLLFASLGVVASAAREYKGNEDTTSAPKMLFISATNLTSESLKKALRSNKAPFIRLFNSSGGVLGNLARGTSLGEEGLAQMLTGNAEKKTLDNSSFISKVSSSGQYSSVVVLPTGQSPVDGLRGSAGNVLTCKSPYELYQYQLPQILSNSLNTDLVFVQVDSFQYTADTIPNSLKVRSDLNLFDNAIGQIGFLLRNHTKEVKENWYIILVGEGESGSDPVPFFGTIYSRGQLVHMRDLPAKASLLDIYGTVMRWFDISGEKYADTALGICSNGINVLNCNES